MKKTCMKIVIWLMYICSIPVLLPFTIVVLIGGMIANKRDFGEFDMKWCIAAYTEGLVEGHRFNMARVDELYD